MNAIISFHNVGRSFGEHTVLKDFTLDIRAGETVTIMGGSGSGKSVTLKVLLGLLQPQKGDVTVQGKSIVTLKETELVPIRCQMGMVFQGAALFDSISVKENVAYPLREHYHYSEEKISRIVAEKLALVGLEGTADMRPADLSGGMKKRVAIARAIVASPKIILYDEPTTGLDPANTLRINGLITKLQEMLKVTSVVVTHDMQSAFQVSDRLALLHNGHIEFSGTPAEVKASDNPVVKGFISGELDDASEISLRQQKR